MLSICFRSLSSHFFRYLIECPDSVNVFKVKVSKHRLKSNLARIGVKRKVSRDPNEEKERRPKKAL